MRIILLLLATFSLLSCEKAEEFICEENTRTAIIRWTGSPAVDGCGWMVEINSKYYIPKDLPAPIQQDGMVVNICYKKLLEKAACGNTDRNTPMIDIREIR